MGEIKGHEYPLKDIFTPKFVFSIPEYQRPYLWTTEHAGELLSDLKASMENSRGEPYFLGSLVLIKQDNQPEASVIDGQQRLTTLSVLIACIRELTEKQDEKNELQSFLKDSGGRFAGVKGKYRLSLRERDQSFFKKYILEEGAIEELINMDPEALSDSRRNICKNTKAFMEELKGLSEQERNGLAEFMMQNCFIVSVSTPDLESAYRIFTILNDRGLELSHTDIIKAKILGEINKNCGESEYKRYSIIWEDLEENLGRKEFEDLFSHIRMIKIKEKAKFSILKEFENSIIPNIGKKEFIDKILIPYADAYDVINGANYQSNSDSQKINELLKWLKCIDNFDWIPPAVLYYSKHKDSFDTLLKFFRDLERLAAGLFITRAYTTDRLKRYGLLLKEIESDSNLFSDSSALQLTEDEKRSVLDVLEGDIYKVRNVPQFVLLRLDSNFSDGAATYDHPVISIEHILPQNPAANSEWLELFPDIEEREYLTNKLGNLVLLARRKNSQASNYDFEMKKHKYFTTANGVSSFAITTRILKEETWCPIQIQEKQKEYIENLKNTWRLA